MKTTDSRDPLDRRIDQLLANKPVRPGPDFADRVLAEAEARGLDPDGPARTTSARLRYLVPLAAAILLSFAAVQIFFKPAQTTGSPSLSAAEVQEILILEEGLSGLAQLPFDAFESSDLEPTIDSINFGFES